jgi:hypothetical protein
LFWPEKFVDNSNNQITLMAISFTLAELVPFMLVVYGIYLQIDWHKQDPNDSIIANNSTMT